MNQDTLADAALRRRPAIGILTGSGPEAGIDLWNKLLQENRRRMGAAFRGDIDAPEVHIVSEPALGLSMELARNGERVWTALEAGARALDGRTQVYAIACNTLNLYAARLQALPLDTRLLSFTDVVAAWLARHAQGPVCVLGGRTVAEMGSESPYGALRGQAEFEIPDAATRAELHQLIYDVKTLGPQEPALADRLQSLLSRIASRTVLLACTELPLIARPGATPHQLVDVTQLVSEALLDHIDGQPA